MSNSIRRIISAMKRPIPLLIAPIPTCALAQSDVSSDVSYIKCVTEVKKSNYGSGNTAFQASENLLSSNEVVIKSNEMKFYKVHYRIPKIELFFDIDSMYGHNSNLSCNFPTNVCDFSKNSIYLFNKEKNYYFSFYINRKSGHYESRSRYETFQRGINQIDGKPYPDWGSYSYYEEGYCEKSEDMEIKENKF